MERTDNILMFVVIDSRVRKFIEVVAVAGPRVGREQADFVGNRFVHKVEYGLGGNTRQNFGDSLPLASARPNAFDFARARIARAAAPLVPMFVLILPADVGFVHLYYTS